MRGQDIPPESTCARHFLLLWSDGSDLPVAHWFTCGHCFVSAPANNGSESMKEAQRRREEEQKKSVPPNGKFPNANNRHNNVVLSKGSGRWMGTARRPLIPSDSHEILIFRPGRKCQIPRTAIVKSNEKWNAFEFPGKNIFRLECYFFFKKKFQANEQRRANKLK